MGASPPAILGGPGSTARQESDIRELREERVQHQLAVVAVAVQQAGLAAGQTAAHHATSRLLRFCIALAKQLEVGHFGPMQCVENQRVAIECGVARLRQKVSVKPALALPAYDQCMKASHLFNLLDARGVISVTERQGYIGRVRKLARGCCEAWVAKSAQSNLS